MVSEKGPGVLGKVFSGHGNEHLTGVPDVALLLVASCL